MRLLTVSGGVCNRSERQLMNAIFMQLKSMHFEKLQGSRRHQRSMRINDRWRLIIEIVGEAPNKKVLIIGIEDYH